MNNEPKWNSRFLVQLPLKFGIAPYVIRSVSLPKFINNDWSEMDLTFFDPITPSTSKGLNKIMKYNKPFKFKINLLDPIGEIIEVWEIHVKNFDIDFGNLNYTSEDLLEPRMLIKPYKCILK